MRVAAIYLASRGVTTALLVLAGLLAPEGSRFGPAAGLPTLVQAWDAQYYLRIATEGYPSILPLTDAGEVAHNAWAFMPVYPWLAGAVGAPFGSWAVGAVLISLVAGYVSCLLMRRLLVAVVGETAALWSVAFFASAPVAAMFQVAYAETLFLALLLWGLLCLQKREYGWIYVIIPVMAYVRPGILAFALALAALGAWRFAHRRARGVRRHELVHLGALSALAAGLGFSWPLIAAAVTGRVDAYLQTELSWRRLWMGDEGAFVPFEGWFQAGFYWFEQWGLTPGWAPVAIVCAVALVVLVLPFEPHVRRLGVEVRIWAASYLIYLLAVFLPQSSLFRLLFPLAPLWGALAQPRSLAWRLGVLAACLAGQAWWIWNVYGLGTEFWHIP